MNSRAIVAAVVLLALAAVPEPAAAARGHGVSVVWGGDVTLGSSYGRPPNRGRPQLAGIAAVLRRADVAAVNYEGTFGSGGPSKCAGGRSNCFAFQAPAANAGTLGWAGVDVVNQANNHAHDFGDSGMAQTHRRCAAPACAGAARPARSPRCAAAARGSPSSASRPTRGARRWQRLRGARARARGGAAGADRRRASCTPARRARIRTTSPTDDEHAYGEDRGDSRHFARIAVDAGADLVLGSGPHVVRGLQLYRDRLIAYSLGNLTGWHNFGTGGNSALSALLRVDLDRNGALARGSLVSLRLDGTGVPHTDPARGAERLMRSLSASDFGEASAWDSFVAELR